MEYRFNTLRGEDREGALSLQGQLGCSFSFARLLMHRGLREREQIDAFLHPMDRPLPDPYALRDMDKAVFCLQQALSQGKRICVYGDYDADGVCATAILLRCLRSLGGEVSYYIPSRHSEGYGMNENAVAALKEGGVELIVTVDNGIASHREITLAYELGMEVVVTDHHRLQGALPKCEAVVCVSREGYRERVNDLCGAGVAYLLACALLKREALELLPLAAVATAADIVDVTGDNRAILVKGMAGIRKQPGLQTLLELAGAGEGEITETTLGFVIAPRLNAAGRIAHGKEALELLLCHSRQETLPLAERLEQLNRQRKEEESRIYTACQQLLSQEEQEPVAVFVGEDWNHGVVGIVAARLTEQLHKPVILLSPGSNGYTGSGRSIEGVDLFALLCLCKDTMLRFGGHAGAAGLSVEEEKLPAFRQAIQKAFVSLFPLGAPPASLSYEDCMPLEECTEQLAREIESLSPFGPGNPEPVFRIPQALLGQLRLMGKEGKHLSGDVSDGRRRLRLVAFSQGYRLNSWMKLEQVDLLVRLQMNRFNGRESLQLMYVALKDSRRIMAGEGEEKYNLVDDFLRELEYNNVSACVAGKLARFLQLPFPSETRLRELYVLLKKGYGMEKRASIETLGSREELMAALIFAELGFFHVQQGALEPVAARRRSIQESTLYRALQQTAL